MLFFIHLFIKYALSAFHVQGLTLGSGDTETQLAGDKRLCSVIMRCWLLFYSAPYLPEKDDAV